LLVSYLAYLPRVTAFMVFEYVEKGGLLAIHFTLGMSPPRRA
jgi:hypothetical protein